MRRFQLAGSFNERPLGAVPAASLGATPAWGTGP